MVQQEEQHSRVNRTEAVVCTLSSPVPPGMAAVIATTLLSCKKSKVGENEMQIKSKEEEEGRWRRKERL